VRTGLALLVLLALAAPASALAHARLVRTAPADGAVVARAPAELRVFFDDVVHAGGGIAAIRNGGGSVLGGPARVEGGRTLVVPLRRGLRDGAYSVRWSVVSDDGHRESSVVAFAVGVGQPVPTPALDAETGRVDGAEVATRWLFLAGLLVSVGIALLALLAGPRRDEERVTLVLSTAAVLTAFGAAEQAHRVGLETRAGTALGTGFVAAVVVATLAGAASLERRALRPALVLALGLAAVPAFAGHALDRGLSRLNVVADVLHVLGAAAWIGALLGLVVLRDAPWRRTGALALGGLVVLGVTGAVRASFELVHPSQLWSTSYGRALLVKTAILGAALAGGWLLRAHGRRRAMLELFVVAGLLVAVSVLVTLRPGRSAVAAQRAAGLPPVAPACSSSSRRQTYQPIASRKTSVCSPFITIPPRFWSRTGESPQSRCVCS
jgi:copper transport protein